MLLKYLIAIAALSLIPTDGKTCGSTTGASSEWTNNANMWFSIPVTSMISGGWTVELEFSDPVLTITIWNAELDSVSADMMTYTLKNKDWNRDLPAGSILEMNFLAQFVGPTPTFTARLSGQPECSAEEPTTASPATHGCFTCCSLTYVINEWSGNFKGQFELPIEVGVTDGWVIEIEFADPVWTLEVYRGIVISASDDGRRFRFKNQNYNGVLPAGYVLIEEFHCTAPSASAFTVNMIGQPECCIGDEPVCSATTTLPSVVTTEQKTTTELPIVTTDERTVVTTQKRTTEERTIVTTDRQITTAQPIVTIPPGCYTCCSSTYITDDWFENFKGEFRIPIQNSVENGWVIQIEFENPVWSLEVYRGIVLGSSDDGRIYQFTNMHYNGALEAGTVLQEEFHCTAESNTAFTVNIIGQPECCSGDVPDCPVTTMAPIVTTNQQTTTERLVQTTDQQTTMTERPVQTTDQQTTMTERPVQTTNLQTTTEWPVQTTDQQTTEGPVATTDGQPTTEGPVQTTDQQTTTEQPVQTTDTQTTEPIPTTSGQSGTTVTPEVTLPESAPFNYYEVLDKSILFYEAQRSGALPANNRIPYRGDSALNDKGDFGEDLTGGWYDAGDFVKFGHPMAGTVTILAWGLIEYRSGYANAGQLDIMLDSIKWATDYFLKCHTAPFEFYGQVGNGGVDHSNWGRPEALDALNTYRPAYVLTPSKPGSDLLGETAAALAAASIAFSPTDPTYAATLLDNAREIYDFATMYEGKYSNSIPDAAGYYSSSGYDDELGWAAAWLFRATSEAQYLNDAVTYYDNRGLGNKPWAFDWDDKKAGLQVLMYQLTQEKKYKDAVTAFLDGWESGADVAYTPLGLAWRIQWSPNRYSANVAFLALVAADLGINPTTYRDFAQAQINYILGSSGRSYVVGFGVNPPDRPHHRSSSCPDLPAPCSWADYNADGPNPQILYGAVIGGPDQNDYFENDRTDFVKNEVACDYNAGFQSSVAGIIALLTNSN